MKSAILACLSLAVGLCSADSLSNMCYGGYCVHKCNDGKCGSSQCSDSLSRCPIFGPKLQQGYSACQIIDMLKQKQENGGWSHHKKHGGHHGVHGGHHTSHGGDQCNQMWVGDGVCDHRCMAYNQDGGDCTGHTHDVNGVALGGSMHGSLHGSHGAMHGAHHGNHGMVGSSSWNMKSGSSGECNTQWVGDGFCDHRCQAYDNDGGDCDGKTHDDSGNALQGAHSSGGSHGGHSGAHSMGHHSGGHSMGHHMGHSGRYGSSYGATPSWGSSSRGYGMHSGHGMHSGMHATSQRGYGRPRHSGHGMHSNHRGYQTYNY